MKKYFYLICVLLFPINLLAQVVINNMENNPIGMAARFLQCDTNTSPGALGTGANWNFGTIAKLHISSVNDTFYINTIANYGSTAPTATRIDSSVFIGNKYINQTSGHTYLLNWTLYPGTYYSYTAPVAGHLIAKQPLAYANSFADTFTASYVGATSPTTVNGIVTTTVDGSGTLILPSGTYSNTLRLHAVEVDTAHDGTGAHPSSQNSYVWYDNYHSVPLCKFVTNTFSTGTSKSYYYLLSQTPLVEIENITKDQPTFTAFFNGSNLTLNGQFEAGHSYGFCVFNLAGQKVYSTSFSSSAANVHFNTDQWIVTGIYVLLLADYNDHTFGSIKVFKQ